MLNTVEVTSQRGDLLTLPMFDISEGFAIEDIGGLGPVKANIITSSIATMDGEQYHDARREARYLTLKLGLEPDFANNTVDDLRQKLYEFFMTKSRVNLKFLKDSGLEVDIVGRVEDVSPDIFSQEPAVDISIVCPNPDFVDLTGVSEAGVTVADQTETLIEGQGSVDTGVVFNLTVTTAISEFTIYHRASDGVVRSLVFSYPLVAGDVVTISTVPGDKFATLTNTSGEASVLYGVSPAAFWFKLEPGDNYLRVYCATAGMAWTVDYTAKYGGL